MFHVKIIINIISRNHKTLRSCVAPSVSPGSISILTRQSKVPTDFRWLLRRPFKVGPANFSDFQSSPRVRPPSLQKRITTPFTLLLNPGSQSLQKHSRFFK